MECQFIPIFSHGAQNLADVNFLNETRIPLAVVSRMTTLQIIMCGRYLGMQALIAISTGILLHSLLEWAFRARPAFLRIAFTLKLPELLKTTLVTVKANGSRTYPSRTFPPGEKCK